MTNEYGNELLHRVLLSAMKDVDKICREHDIKYFLHAGTLLGAVNYHGFIPWDDDVDISMMRDDYERFCDIICEYKDQYFIQTYKTDPDYPNNRAILRILGTHVNYLHDNRQGRHEIGIDIVPLDAVPDNMISRRIQQLEVWCLDAAVQIKMGSIIPHHPFMKCIAILAKKDRRILGEQIDRVTTRYNKISTKSVGLLSYTGRNPYTGKSGYENDIMLREWYENARFLQFEDTQFMTISEYKQDLLHRYGPDYMKPYPEEKRVTKHDVKSYDVEPWVMERLP